MILVIILTMLIASTFTLGKAVLMYMPPILTISIRMILGGGMLLGYFWYTNKRTITIARRDYWLFFQITLWHIYVSYITEFWALNYMSSAKACLLFNLSPFITALLAMIILSERITYRKSIGLLIGFLGFFPILLSTSNGTTPIEYPGFISLPEIALIISVASSAYGWIVMKQLIDRGNSPVMINAVSMFIGGVAALATSVCVEGYSALNNLNSTSDILAFSGYMLALVLIGNVICYNLYGYLLRRYSTTFLSFAGVTTPLFAAFYGWLFLHEHITFWFFVSVVIVSIGLYVFYQEELRTWHVT